MDIDWIMQGTLAKEISQKKAIMEEKAVAIKRVKMGSQKVFRELAMETVMSKVEIIEFDQQGSQKNRECFWRRPAASSDLDLSSSKDSP